MQDATVTQGKALARAAAIVVAAGCALVWRVPTAGGQPVSDDFDSTTTNAFWRFDDTIGDCSLLMDGTHAVIDVGRSVAHEITPTVVGVPRLLQPADDRDFEIEAKFDNPPAIPIQSQGIIVQQDGDTVLHFGVSAIPGLPPGYALHAAFSDIGGATGTLYHTSFPPPHAAPAAVLHARQASAQPMDVLHFSRRYALDDRRHLHVCHDGQRSRTVRRQQLG